MTRIRRFFTDRVVHFRLLPGSKPVAQPWFGIGPVWDTVIDQHVIGRVVGVSVQFGRHGFAIHRRIR